MTTARPLPLLVFALLLAAACVPHPSPRTPRPPQTPRWEPRTPYALLHHRAPETSWEPWSEISADFDGDGVPDFALRGVYKDRVIVGIVQGPLRSDSRTWRLEFPWGKGTEDSLCSRRAKIAVEEVDAPRHTAGRQQGRHAKGIDLYDDRCDSFHIYWSPEEGKFDWWRL